MKCPECPRQAVILRALGDPDRLEIAKKLLEGKITADNLCNYLGKARTDVFRHLWFLKDMGIVERPGFDGEREYFSLVDESAIMILRTLNRSSAKKALRKWEKSN